MTHNTFVEVKYLVVTGGSGSTGMRFGEVVQWLRDRPGYMIIGIKELWG